MDIKYINSLLKSGKSVREIRSIMNCSEKNFQKQIKAQGYKYDQKLKQYVENTSNTESNTLCTTSCNTQEITTIQKESLNFIGENIELLKEMLMYYKCNTESNTNNNGIIIDLIDDKQIDNGKPKSVRVNEYVWREWKEFTSKINYSSKNLVSMALLEYMRKYKEQK